MSRRDFVFLPEPQANHPVLGVLPLRTFRSTTLITQSTQIRSVVLMIPDVLTNPSQRLCRVSQYINHLRHCGGCGRAGPCAQGRSPSAVAKVLAQ